ncbi:hypothetical protein Q5H93_17420 [Hymenobacter sp. ASUV-10]|uniref:Uncharacterized protein n=1 Tax=Hymenobacter aranciens TaxID=3063996 RepID=A0ABT9BE32_9BACT|nr:hypothetical protein [Hymenobacter sp. ASUV-10]MDO7876528.1 hypothetical protein [Hymenobacter sp. ASUV-10]
MHYQEQVEKVLGTHQHSSLRTCFDPYAHEWSETTLPQKAAILHKCVTAGLSIEHLVREYQFEYSELKGAYAVEDTHIALAAILNHVFLAANAENPFLK